MQQLSASDARFLYADSANANANVTLVHIYDQSTAPGGHVRFKTILAHIESRLGRSPVFRRRLQRVPLELDYPYWVDDERFDLEYHVRHIALPKPGDWRQFCIQASRIHARPLDLSRPLWEIYVIEGLDAFLDLPPGSFALLTKTHHAAIDPERGSELTDLLHDPFATPAAPPPPAPWFPERAPGSLGLVKRGVTRTVASPMRLAAPLTRAIGRIAPAAVAFAGDLFLHPERQLPPTRFNAVVSPHRVFETRRFTLAEFKAIRTLVDGDGSGVSATVNDVVLAVCGGALRRYLQGHGELPAASLTAIAPVYLRGADAEPAPAPRPRGRGAKAAASARPTAPRAEMQWMPVQLGTNIDDPVMRLRAICEQTASAHAEGQGIAAPELAEVAQQTPAATLALASKMLGRAALALNGRAPLAHCTITNVPGPAQPQYLCGARLSYFSAIMPITDGMGLVIAVTSYDGRLIVSPTSCRELMPDPAHFAQCVRDSFQEYLGRVGKGGGVKKAVVRRETTPAAPRRQAAGKNALAGVSAPAARARARTPAGRAPGAKARATARRA